MVHSVAALFQGQWALAEPMRTDGRSLTTSLIATSIATIKFTELDLGSSFTLMHLLDTMTNSLQRTRLEGAKNWKRFSNTKPTPFPRWPIDLCNESARDGNGVFWTPPRQANWYHRGRLCQTRTMYQFPTRTKLFTSLHNISVSTVHFSCIMYFQNSCLYERQRHPCIQTYAPPRNYLSNILVFLDRKFARSNQR